MPFQLVDVFGAVLSVIVDCMTMLTVGTPAPPTFDPGPIGPKYWERMASQLIVAPETMTEHQRILVVRYLWDRQYRYDAA
jgi:hypothetical protein